MQKKQLQKIVQKLADESFRDGKLVEPQVAKSIKILKSLSKTQSIQALSDYLKNIRREERKHTLYIETATDLSSVQVKKVRKLVERKVRIIKTLINVNPEIIGGFKIKIGDEVWDETVAGKINQLKEVISGRSSRSN